MNYRILSSRLRLGSAVALPVAIAALAFAGSASAATEPTVVYTPTTGTQLVADTVAADAQPAGTLSIIELGPTLYSIPNPTGSAAMTLSGNIEITGAPTFQANFGLSGASTNPGGNQEPEVNGDSITTPSDLFQVEPGANVLFKAFDMEGGGSFNTQFASIQVEGGATVEIDNMGLVGSQGPAVFVQPAGATGGQGGVATITNSEITSTTQSNGTIFNNSNLPVTMVNDTFEVNNGGLVGANFVAINTLFVQDGTSPCSNPLQSPSTNNLTDLAGVCGSSMTTTTDQAIDLQGAAPAYGGPTTSDQILAPSTAIGKGNVSFCPSLDQRFMTRSSGTCDVGSYQTTADNNTPNGASLAPPTCPTTGVINESSNPATETVSASNSTTGLGPDAISYVANPASADNGTATGFPTPSEAIPTDNGTVSYPVLSNAIGATWFAATNPGASLAAQDDLPSTQPIPVTATKPLNDTTVNDTHWSFDLSDWAGIASYCH